MEATRQFIEFFRPQIRQDQLIKHVTTALGIDDAFRGQFAAARPLLASEMKGWGDLVLTNLINHHHLPPDLSQAEVMLARNIFLEHRRAVIEARFDDEYFTSIENVALFFIYHNVVPLFVIGAIKSRVDAMIQQTIKSPTAAGRLPTIASLVTLFAIEANQIQRVFIAYHGSGSLDILNEEDGLEHTLSHQSQKGFGKAHLAGVSA